MASFWLLPRFNAFQELHPDIDVRILAVDSLKDIRHSEFDIALFFCHEPPADLTATPLFCRKRLPGMQPRLTWKRISLTCQPDTEDMLNGTLLTLEVEEEWLSWQAWFKACDIEYKADAGPRMNINNYLLVIQSALNGQGLALGWENLVDDYLSQRPADQTGQHQCRDDISVSDAGAGANCIRPKLGAEVFSGSGCCR